MILNGDEIIEQYNLGRIYVSSWDSRRVGPNSYNVTLNNEILVIDEPIVDLRYDRQYKRFDINEHMFSGRPGFLLKPGMFVLGATEEIVRNDADDLVPMIEGRSSIARCGLTVHISAGFGDIGFNGRWTLEMTTEHPIFLYHHMPIAQLYWIRTNPTSRRYQGKYQGRVEPIGCRLVDKKGEESESRENLPGD
jgi:dCTP deaminase